MNKKKVVFLNLFKIAFPITAIVSIAHRISGFFLFLTIPFLLYVLSSSYASEESFNIITGWLSDYLWLISLIILAFVYHLCAGIRHLLMDIGIGEKNIQTAKKSALALIVCSVIVFILVLII